MQLFVELVPPSFDHLLKVVVLMLNPAGSKSVDTTP
jgi:hypothetical protein